MDHPRITINMSPSHHTSLRLATLCVMLTVLLVSPVHVCCASIADVARLKTDIFQNYDKTIRPARNQSNPTRVQMDFALEAITGFSEQTDKFTVMGWFDIIWTDEFLAWNSSLYGGVDRFLVPQGDIWKPDVVLSNPFDNIKEMGDDFLTVELHADGSVNWYPGDTSTSGV
jgi:hypothetical protein